MRVLVTGSGGFIGAAVTAALENAGIDVVRHFRNVPGSEDESKEFVSGDLRNGIEIPANIETVVHCAGLAHQPTGTAADKFTETNVDATRLLAQNTLDAHIKRFILISSVSVYGNEGYDGLVTEDTQAKPTTSYGQSKLGGEIACLEVFDGTEIDLYILRPATVIGEGDRANMHRLISMINSGLFLMIGKGLNRKSFVHISDLANVVCALAQRVLKEGGTYNVSADPITVEETVSTIYKALGKPRRIIRLPESLSSVLALAARVSGKLRGMSESIATWIRDDAYSSVRLEEIIKIKIPSPEAIRREVRWFMNRND